MREEEEGGEDCEMAHCCSYLMGLCFGEGKKMRGKGGAGGT